MSYSQLVAQVLMDAYEAQLDRRLQVWESVSRFYMSQHALLTGTTELDWLLDWEPL